MERISFLIVVFFSLVSTALTPGCQKPASVALVPVKVDQEAAFPEQTPGTKLPVLDAVKLLTQEELEQGYVQFFDGVSTYGWSVENGDENNFFVAKASDKSSQGLIVKDEGRAIHDFSGFSIEFSDSQNTVVAARWGWATHTDSKETINVNAATGESHSKSIITNIKAIPQKHNMQPLGESDWKPATEPCRSVWEDGVLTLTGGSGMVESTQEYGDFILQLEYLTEPTEPGINSGVFFRCIPGEQMNGYECQILNKASEKDYEKFIGTDTGGIFRRQVGRNVAPKDGQWNYLTIAAHGPKVATWVNGIQVTDWTDTREPHKNPRNGLRLEPGTLQLQGHDPGTKIQFRNFRVANIVQNP